MATIDLVKQALKSTTKMSLNDRFQLLRQQNVSNKPMANTNTNRQALRQGSQRNRRLALQMASRPSVLAALRLNNNQRTQNRQNIQNNRQNIKQRLGVKRFNNQSINNQLNRNQFPNNRNRKPINRSNFNNNLNRNPNQNFVRNNQRRRNVGNNSQNRATVTAVRPKGLKGNQNKGVRRAQAFKGTQNAMRSGFKPKQRQMGQQMRANQAKTGIKKKFQINRNFNTRKQTQRKGRPVKPDREQLDNDLDAYMAKTKSHLDAEIDVYMSQAN